MRRKKTAQGIEVRKISFPFPSDFHVHWQPKDPALSQLINGTSLFLPYMEPFILIDLNALRIDTPTMINDLPAGMPRLMQKAQGYVATVVNGEIVQENGKETGARPGKVVRGTETPSR